MKFAKQTRTVDEDVIATAYVLAELRNEPSCKAASGRRSKALQELYDAVERHRSSQTVEVQHATT